jgi:hypothetical protein
MRPWYHKKRTKKEKGKEGRKEPDTGRPAH